MVVIQLVQLMLVLIVQQLLVSVHVKLTSKVLIAASALMEHIIYHQLILMVVKVCLYVHVCVWGVGVVYCIHNEPINIHYLTEILMET